MSQIRLALSIIGLAYAVLGLAVVFFAMSLGRNTNIGGVFLAVMILGWGGSIAAGGLFAGSLLGTLALARHIEARRPWPMLLIVSGWIAALVLGWFAWEFWTHSALPEVAT